MKLSRVLSIALVALVLCIGATVASCGDEPEEAELQTSTVLRGSLSVDIAASGNLALSVVDDLAFEMSGTVEAVLVEAGESVEEGQLLAKLDTSESEKELVALELSLLQAEIEMENAELALEQAEEGTGTAITGDITTQTTDPKEIEILELRLQLAEARYTDAEEALAEARDASPEIIAPFDGFVTSVNIEGGDEVMKGTVAVALADPDRFEADILVSELDISEIELGSTAWVEVDALGVTLPAEVVHISPTSIIQSGVVNYTVRVELQPIEAISFEGTEADGSQGPSEGFEIPEGFELPEGFEMPDDFSFPEGQLPTVISGDIQLRQGMTVTVSIIVAERTDTLMVPNGAILTRGLESYVQIMLEDGTIEERTVTTGISNWQYTEVTEGLSEGELVVVPEGTMAVPDDFGQWGGPGMSGATITVVPGMDGGGPPGD